MVVLITLLILWERERASMAGDEGRTERHGRHVREQGECGPEPGPAGHPSRSRAAKTA